MNFLLYFELDLKGKVGKLVLVRKTLDMAAGNVNIFLLIFCKRLILEGTLFFVANNFCCTFLSKDDLEVKRKEVRM